MYVTRPLSMYKKEPSLFTLPPPEGPNSGVLLIEDIKVAKDELVKIHWCCGEIPRQEEFPFPQNKNLTVTYTNTDGYLDEKDVILIPVLDQPLSSNLYYCIDRTGTLRGEPYPCSEEKAYFCYSSSPNNKYHQFRIEKMQNHFSASSAFGRPPYFLRSYWGMHKSDNYFELPEAKGLDNTIRDKLPDFINSSNFPFSEKTISSSSPSVVVGKWLCPLMFIKYINLESSMCRSRFYLMTLEQHWEQIFACENINDPVINVDVVVEAEKVAICGDRKQVTNDYKRDVVNEVMWFKADFPYSVAGRAFVGLSLAIVERMRFEVERFGWVSGDKCGKVKLNKEFGGNNNGDFKKFGCYVLVERFVLRRLDDGNVILTHDFRHTQHIRTKWE